MYKRVTNIADKVKDARLKIDEWRVLFAVDNNSDAQKIADFLELSIEKVNDALEQLVESGFIASGEMKEEVQPEVKEETPEEKAEDLVEELFTEEEAEAPVEETGTDEEAGDANEDSLLSEIVEEVVEEPVMEEPVAEEPVIQEPVVEEEKEEDLEEIILDEEKEEEVLETISDEAEALTAEVDLAPEPESAGEEKVELEEEAPAAEQPPVEKKSGESKTVLVVDDSIVIRKMVEIALENENFNIETAVSGKEALEKVDAVSPDLVILDIMLPDVSGIEILKAIKASKGMPVIMLSGKNSPQDLELAKTQGADDFAPKPFKEEELVEKIKALI